MSLATGSVVCFIDSDQRLEPGAARELIKAFEDEHVGAVVLPERSTGEGYLARSRDLEKRLIEGDAHAEAARAFRADTLRQLGGYSVTLNAFEDYELHDRVVAEGWKVGRIDSRVWHDEGRVRPIALIRKKAYYGQALGTFAAKRGVRTTLSRVLRPGFFRPTVLASDPLAIPGLAFLKALDLLGVVVGLFSAAPDDVGAIRKEATEKRSSRAILLTYLAPVAIVIAASFSWYDVGAFVAYGDNGPAFRRGLLTNVSHIWGYSITGAGSRVGDATRLFEAIIFRSADALGLSAPAAQHIYSAFWLAATALAVVFVIRQLMANATISAGLAALVAIGNPLVLTGLPNPLILAAITAVCAAAGVLVRVARGDRTSVTIVAIASLPLSYLAMNPAWLATGIAGGTIVGLGYTAALYKGAGVKRALSFAMRLVPLLVVVHAWWIVPSVLAIQGSKDVVNAQTDVDAWSFTHASASISRLLKFTAYWGWDDFYPWTEFFDGPPGSVLLWIVPFLALVSPIVVDRRRSRRIAVASVALGLVALFLAKGLHTPLGSVNGWLYDHVPGFWLFREPFNKLGLIAVVAFTIAIAVLIDELAPAIRYVRGVTTRWLIALACVAMLLTPTFPLYNGAVARRAFGELPSSRVFVPAVWKTIANRINDDPNAGKVLVLPTLPYYQMTTTWGFHGVGDLPRELLTRAVLLELPGGYYRDPRTQSSIIHEVERRLDTEEADGVVRLLDSLGVSHVLVRQDFGPQIVAPPNRDAKRLIAALASTDLFAKPETYPRVATLFARRNNPSPLRPYSTSAVVSASTSDGIARLLSILPRNTVPIEGSDFRGSRHQATRIEFDPKSAPDESPVRAVSLQKMTRVGNCNTAGGGVGLAAAHLGSTGVRLRAKQGSACTTVRLPDLRADENYQLGFEQRTIRGAPARVCVWFDATGECANASTSSKLTRNFRKTLAEFTTPKDDSTARLFLYADGLGAGETVTEYRNFSLKRIVPYALVTFEEHAQRTPRVDVLSAQRERIRFRVRQAATFVLAMADATDPGWKIEGVPKGSNVRPVLVDGYRQGWQIRTTSPFVGTIRFRPARWLRWAQAASFISIAALLALVAYRLTTRYRRGRLFEPEAHIE